MCPGYGPVPLPSPWLALAMRKAAQRETETDRQSETERGSWVSARGLSEERARVSPAVGFIWARPM